MDGAENLHLAEELTADCEVVGVAMDEFERVGGGSPLVIYLVDCAAITMAKDLEFLEVSGRDSTEGRVVCDGGGGKEGNGETGQRKEGSGKGRRRLS